MRKTKGKVSRITDKQRLDWQKKHKVRVFHTTHNKPAYAWIATYGSSPTDVWGCGPTPRAAIDAAIKAERQSARKVGGGK